MIGLASVTFRHLDWKEIIAIAAQNSIDGIEWGSDVHLPEGDIKKARLITEASENMGLTVISYGSYYHLTDAGNQKLRFEQVLKTAIELKAPLIRIWAGRKGSDNTSSAMRKQATKELKQICEMAAEHGIGIALEKHRNTLTDTSESTIELIESASCVNLSTYWQPNPEWSVNINLKEVELLKSYISNVHVFHWAKDNMRLALTNGISDWQQYLKHLVCANRNRYFILEFIRDDSIKQVSDDVSVLCELLTC